jgi:endoglucanase
MLFFTKFSFAYGAGKEDFVEFKLTNVQNTANGSDVKLNFNGNNDELSISMNTKNLDKGYYTAYIYENENRDWSNYEAVAFNLENKSEVAIKINLNIKESNGSLLSLYDNSRILLKRDGSEVMESVHTSYGTIELAKNFKGTIYMPFNSFNEKDKTSLGNTKSITKIQSFGIVAVLPENQEVSFVVNKFALINKDSSINKYFNTNFLIKGEDTVEIPVAGEGISDYKVEAYNNEGLSSSNIKFKLKESVAGISLSNTGRLTLTPEVEPQKIQICAVIDGTINETMDVELMKSWTLDAKEVDGTSKSIPKAEEVPEIISNENNILLNKNVLMGTRVAIILIAISFGILYLHWKKQKDNVSKNLKKAVKRKSNLNKKYILTFLLCIVLLGSIFSALNKINNKNEYKMPFKSCINIGNSLEAPKDMSWGVDMNVEYFDEIKKAGFDSVRIPVRFSDYAKDSPNYKLDEDFMKQLDSYIDYAIKDDLVVILDFHHFEEIMEEPERYKECFISIWNQVSERYKDYPSTLIFELLNEPKDNLKGKLWNEFIRDGVKEIRKSNKDRAIIVGPDNFYSVDRLEALSIPKDDNIIVSFHYYEPNKFTFQGNEYHLGFENLKDIQWKGSKEEIEYLENRFDIAKKWSDKNKVGIFLGEFGANQKAPAESRKLWTKAVRKEAEKRNFSYGYWEFCSWFGIYDVKSHTWDKDILEALIPEK